MVWGLSITVGCAMVCHCPILTSTRIHLVRSGFNELGPYRIQKYHQSASDGGTSEEEDPCHRKEENEWSEDEEVNKNSCFSSSSNVLVEDACFHIDLLQAWRVQLEDEWRWWKICFSPAMEKHPCHEFLHSINIHRKRRSQQSGNNEGVGRFQRTLAIQVHVPWDPKEMSWTIPKLAEHSRWKRLDRRSDQGSWLRWKQGAISPKAWTGQEVNKVVAMGLHEGTKEPDVCC